LFATLRSPFGDVENQGEPRTASSTKAIMSFYFTFVKYNLQNVLSCPQNDVSYWQDNRRQASQAGGFELQG
jgi:hypothetical protein